MNENYNIFEKLREQIDRTDEEILILLKRRFQTVKKIGKYKKDNNIEIEDRNRENNLIIAKIAKARTMQLDEAFIRDLFELIIDESKKIQEENNKK